MPVSSGLQKYFDSKKPKKGDMQQKFASLAGQIDPAFMQSFEAFHDKIMNIVEENPEAESLVSEELGELDEQMKTAGRKHNLRKAEAIIDVAEKA